MTDLCNSKNNESNTKWSTCITTYRHFGNRAFKQQYDACRSIHVFTMSTSAQHDLKSLSLDGLMPCLLRDESDAMLGGALRQLNDVKGFEGVSVGKIESY